MTKIEKLTAIDKLFTENKNNIQQPADLIPILKDFIFSMDELKGDLLYPEDLPYGRNVIFRSENFEAILMNWKPKQSSYIHDHGNSFGVVYVLTDGGNNVAYDSDYHHIATIPLMTGDFVEVPKGIYHRIENPTDIHSVTLHFYAPPLNGMKVIDTKDVKRQFIVSNETGAWEPKKEEIVKNLVGNIIEN